MFITRHDLVTCVVAAREERESEARRTAFFLAYGSSMAPAYSQAISGRDQCVGKANHRINWSVLHHKGLYIAHKQTTTHTIQQNTTRSVVEMMNGKNLIMQA